MDQGSEVPSVCVSLDVCTCVFVCLSACGSAQVCAGLCVHLHLCLQWMHGSHRPAVLGTPFSPPSGWGPVGAVGVLSLGPELWLSLSLKSCDYSPGRGGCVVSQEGNLEDSPHPRETTSRPGFYVPWRALLWNWSCSEIPWTEEPGGLQSPGPWRVGHDWGTELTLILPNEQQRGQV